MRPAHYPTKMVAPSGDPGVAPASDPGDISVALGRIASIADNLLSRVEGLRARLQPVCLGTPQQPAPEKPPCPPMSDLANAMHKQADVLEAAGEILLEIDTGLQLPRQE